MVGALNARASERAGELLLTNSAFMVFIREDHTVHTSKSCRWSIAGYMQWCQLLSKEQSSNLLGKWDFQCDISKKKKFKAWTCPVKLCSLSKEIKENTADMIVGYLDFIRFWQETKLTLFRCCLKTTYVAGSLFIWTVQKRGLRLQVWWFICPTGLDPSIWLSLKDAA